MAEYALILGGIAVVVIAGILFLGPADPRPVRVDRQLGQELPELVVRRYERRRSARAPAPGGPPLLVPEPATDRVLSERATVPMMSSNGRTTIRTLRHHVAYLRRGNGGETNRPETRATAWR